MPKVVALRMPIFAIAVVAAALTGCGGATPSEFQSTGWINGGAMPGKTAATIGGFGGQNVVLVWADVDGILLDTPKPLEPGVVQGAMGSKDGRRAVRWSCQTADGKTGVVVINEQTYDLSKGAVFLVRTIGPRGSQPTIRQISIDLSKLSGQLESVAQLAKDEPAIAAFVGNATD